MLSVAERNRRATQRQASEAIPLEQRRRASLVIPEQKAVRDRVMRMAEMVETSGLSRWTIKRAVERGELELIKLSERAVGCRESNFWAWIDSKKA